MRAQPRQGRKPPGRLRPDDTGLQGTQTNPLHPLHFMDALYQVQKPVPISLSSLQVQPIGTDVNASKHHLPAARLDHSLNLPENILLAAAVDSPPHIGDNAVGAKLIAALLYLNVSPGMLLGPFQVWGVFFPTAHFLPACQIAFHHLHYILLPIIPHGKVNAVVLPAAGLDIAPHSHHNRLRVKPPGPVQQLPALPVRNSRNRTCIYNINICRLIKRHNLVSLFLEHLPHQFRFIGINLAAEIIQCHIFHAHSSLFLCCFRLDFYPLNL